jgi:hypothetical protein
MLLLITDEDDRHEAFTLDVAEFEGYLVYQAVNERWGTAWHKYTVVEGDQVRERVLNARTLR